MSEEAEHNSDIDSEEEDNDDDDADMDSEGDSSLDADVQAMCYMEEQEARNRRFVCDEYELPDAEPKKLRMDAWEDNEVDATLKVFQEQEAIKVTFKAAVLSHSRNGGYCEYLGLTISPELLDILMLAVPSPVTHASLMDAFNKWIVNQNMWKAHVLLTAQSLWEERKLIIIDDELPESAPHGQVDWSPDAKELLLHYPVEAYDKVQAIKEYRNAQRIAAHDKIHPRRCELFWEVMTSGAGIRVFQYMMMLGGQVDMGVHYTNPLFYGHGYPFTSLVAICKAFSRNIAYNLPMLMPRAFNGYLHLSTRLIHILGLPANIVRNHHTRLYGGHLYQQCLDKEPSVMCQYCSFPD